MKQLLVCIAALPLCLCFAPAASADVFFGFSQDGSTPTDSGPLVVNANVGQMLSFDIILVETGADTAINDFGVTGFTLGGEYNTGFASIISESPDPIFNAPNAFPTVNAVDGKLYLEALDFQLNSVEDTNMNGTVGDDGDISFGVGRGQSSLRVATIQIQVTAEGVTHLDLNEPSRFAANNPQFNLPSGGGSKAIGLGFVIGQPKIDVDEIVFGTDAAPRSLRLTINSVIAVPEPSTAAFFSLLAGGMVLRRRR